MEKKAAKKDTHEKKAEAPKKAKAPETAAKAADHKPHHEAKAVHKDTKDHDHGPKHEKKETKAHRESSAKDHPDRHHDSKKHAEPHHHHDSVKVKMPARQCKVQGCKRGYRAKGYCVAHYRKWRHGEYGRARFKTCKDYGCSAQMALNRHGFCENHFQSYYVKGMEQSKIPAAAPEKKPAEKVA